MEGAIENPKDVTDLRQQMKQDEAGTVDRGRTDSPAETLRESKLLYPWICGECSRKRLSMACAIGSAGTISELIKAGPEIRWRSDLG